MAATSIMILGSNASFDTVSGKYNVAWIAVDDEGAGITGDTFFDITETAPVVNARMISDAKDVHNTLLGTSFNVATPSALFSGMS